MDKEFEKLLQSNEVYRDVLGKWGAEITRNFIHFQFQKEREKLIAEIEEFINKNQDCGACNLDLELKKYLHSLSSKEKEEEG